MFRIICHVPTTMIQQQRSIYLTSIFYAEPLRKKKVINPLITKKQFERKIRRLEREINRLESNPPKLKPIIELQLPPHVIRELDQRKRAQNDNDKIVKLANQYYKIWSIYKGIESKEEMKYIKSVVQAQEKAMNILKSDYPDLYSKAVEIDPDLIPYKVEAKKHTPPNESYRCPDGRETDITKEWKL